MENSPSNELEVGVRPESCCAEDVKNIEQLSKMNLKTPLLKLALEISSVDAGSREHFFCLLKKCPDYVNFGH